jgi:S1-C subfamily serine protease
VLLLVLGLAGTGARGGADPDDLAVARGLEARLQATIARVRSAVVTVSVEARQGETVTVSSGGSGVIISPDGFVLTNDHVTAGEARVQIGLRDGRVLGGDVVGRDRTGDVAVVKVRGDALPAATLGDSSSLREGDLVLALGNPFGLAREDHEPAATLGIVSGLHRFQGGEKVYGDAIQIDAAVNPGNSGGPLFDVAGRVVGLTGRISIRGSEKKNSGVGFAVPIDQIKLVLDDLKVGRDVTRGFLGVQFAPDRAEGEREPGVLVQGVRAGTPADVAGLRRGDRITAVDGRPVDHPVRLENWLSVLPAGTVVRIAYVRDGHPFQTQAVLGRRPGP